MSLRLLAAVVLTYFAPVASRAQRVAPSALASVQASRADARMPASRSMLIYSGVTKRARDAADDSAHTGSNAAAWGALAGALIGGAYGYALGRGCYDIRNDGPCRRTVFAGGVVVGAVVGYGMGSIIAAAHDRNHPK